MQEKTEENTQQITPERHTQAAQFVVLEAEITEPFIAMIAAIEADVKPENWIEKTLVEDIAANRWRQLRTRTMEKSLLDYDFSESQVDDVDNATRTALAFRSVSDESRIFDLLGRSENRYGRNMASAFHFLLKLRAVRETAVNHSESPRAEPWRSGNGRTAPPAASSRRLEDYMRDYPTQDNPERNRKENL